MGAGVFVNLARANMAHLFGLLLYCVIAIAFSLLFYKIFAKIIPLNISFDSSATEQMTAVILAVGVSISISLIIALNATTPPQPLPFPRSISITRGNSVPSATQGCEGGCSSKTGPPRKVRINKPKDTLNNNNEAENKEINKEIK